MKKYFAIIFFVIIISSSISVNAQAKRDLLCNRASQTELNELLIPQNQYHPFPTLLERSEWEKIPASLRNDYIKKGEAELKKKWETLPASVFLDYQRNGNRTRYEDICFGRRQRLMTFVLAEIFENKGRFLDEIANGVWLVCEETFWGIPAHVGAQKRGNGLPDVTDPIIDLFAAETGSMLAYVNYLMGDKLKEVSPLITERIALEENRRIITPYFEKEFWWRKGTNNWNPWINSNVLAVILFMEKDNGRRTEAVYKTMQSVDYLINSYPDDGGCDEGPNYWTRAAGCLFDYLELLNSSTAGKINLYDEPLIKKMGQFIYLTWIKDNYYINFADASAKSTPNAGLIFRFGRRINDPKMIGFSAYVAEESKFSDKAPLTEYGSLNVVLPNLFIMKELAETKPVEPYVADTYLPGLQVMAARSFSNSAKGFYLAAKGGHNAESHNHNDVGNFVVYHNGRPVLIDVGVETYTSKTFSSKRYEIWTMQSQFHNLPTINGIQQKDGKDFHAENVSFSPSEKQVSFSLDLTKCYPATAKISSLKRSIILERGKEIILTDEYDLKEWSSPYMLNLMTCQTPDCSKEGIISLSSASGNYEIVYDKNKFTASKEEIKISDARLKPVWGDKVFRLVLKAKDNKTADKYKIEIKTR